MRLRAFILLLTALPVGSSMVSRRAPQIEAHTALSAHPVELAEGKSGPINRYAFDITGFEPSDRGRELACLYPGGLAYRCPHEFVGHTGNLWRVVVSIPDLRRGHSVVVRFRTRQGESRWPVDLTNLPRVVHEIESLALAAGGADRVSGTGGSAPVLHLLRQRSPTVPALAVPAPQTKSRCDDVQAEWLSASATDPVFASDFGALHGGVTVAAPVRRGARVDADNLPLWLVTYPRSARQVQFIAHYEVLYRIGLCPGLVIPGS